MVEAAAVANPVAVRVPSVVGAVTAARPTISGAADLTPTLSHPEGYINRVDRLLCALCDVSH